MSDITAAAPPLMLENVLAMIKGVIAKQPPQAQVDLNNALRWLEPAIAADINAAITAYANKIPIVGGLVGDAIKTAIDAGLENGLADLIDTPTPSAGA